MTAIFTPALKMIFLREGSDGCPGATPYDDGPELCEIRDEASEALSDGERMVARVCKDGVERVAWGEFMAWPGGVTRGRLLYQQVIQRPSFKMVISCALQREREQRAQVWWFEYVKRREDEDGSFGQSGWEDRKTCEARLMLAQRRRHPRGSTQHTCVFGARNFETASLSATRTIPKHLCSSWWLLASRIGSFIAVWSTLAWACRR